MARQRVLESTFFGIYWTVILRTTRVRLSGLKYLVEAIPIYKLFEEYSEEKKIELLRNYYPNINVLVLNSLLAGMSIC